MTLNLYVALYRPLPNTGNYQQWALSLSSTEDIHLNTLIPVLEAHPTFKSGKTTGDDVLARAFSPRIFLEQMHLCEVQRGDIQQLREIAANAKVDNEMLDLTFQDYVVEVLGALEEACFDGGDDDSEYAENKENTMQRHGRNDMRGSPAISVCLDFKINTRFCGMLSLLLLPPGTCSATRPWQLPWSI